MSKIILKEIKNLFEQSGMYIDNESIEKMPMIGVHHCHEWDHGYENWSGININTDGTYNTKCGYHGTRREFYADLRESMYFMLDFIKDNNLNEVIIAPCHRISQFTYNADKNDIYIEIYQFLKSYQIRLNSQAGVRIPINGNETIIEMVLEGAFRDVSNLCLFFPSKAVLLAPNHHFDLPFFTPVIDCVKISIMKLLEHHPNMRSYEKGD